MIETNNPHRIFPDQGPLIRFKSSDFCNLEFIKKVNILVSAQELAPQWERDDSLERSVFELSNGGECIETIVIMNNSVVAEGTVSSCPAWIDLFWIVKNALLLASSFRVSAIALKVIECASGTATAALSSLMAWQGKTYADSQFDRFEMALQKGEYKEAVLSGILASTGLAYSAIIIAAIIIGIGIVAGLTITISMKLLVTVTVALSLCSLALYVGTTLYGLAKGVTDYFYFRKEIMAILNDPSLSRKEKCHKALLFVRQNPEVLKRATSGLLTEHNSLSSQIATSGQMDELIDSPNHLSQAEQMLELIVQSNYMELVGDVLLCLAALAGIAAVLVSGPVGHALFILVALLWLVALDHPDTANKIRFFFWEHFGQKTFQEQLQRFPVVNSSL